MYCVFGTGIKTMQALHYTDDFNGPHVVDYGGNTHTHTHTHTHNTHNTL